ncbi:hypothetical protein CN918_28865 [Priestia megaterium]|nr:hypothetical protein CN918_28865 [Priestia megaterium]
MSKSKRIEDIATEGHSLMNSVVVNTAKEIGEAKLVFRWDEIMKERGISQKDLSLMTGMRTGTISEIVNGKGISINKVQLFALMAALRVTDISEIMEVRFPEEQKITYNYEALQWKVNKKLPESVRELYKRNVLASTVDKEEG